MLESLIMLSGAVLGYLLLKTNTQTKAIIAACNNKLQVICVAVIIFIMGINLGSIDNFAAKMLTLGWQSLIFAIVPTVCSVVAVYFISEKYIARSQKKDKGV